MASYFWQQSSYMNATQAQIKGWEYTHEGGCSSVIYQGEAYDGTFEMITTEHPSISAEELEKLWLDYPKFGEYDQLIRLDRIPKGALERILEYTDKEFPAFRQYLQRDIKRYQEPKKWIRVEVSVLSFRDVNGKIYN